MDIIVKRPWYSRLLDRHVLELALLQFSSYFILTFNYRAVAEVDYVVLLLTDLAIAAVNFSSIKRVAQASTNAERAAYVFGGAAGALIALKLSTFIFA